MAKKSTKKVAKKAPKKAVKRATKKATKKAVVKKSTSKKTATKKVATKKVATKKGATKKITTKKVVAPKKATKKIAVKTTVKKVPSKATTKKASAPKKQSAAVIPSVSLRIGDVAPDFTLHDQNGALVTLSDFRGQNVVVYFYPKAMTPGCTVQACSLRDSQSTLKENNIVVVGISADPVNKLKQFEEKDHLNFPLLSDEGHRVADAYGSWGVKKFMGKEFEGVLRQSFLIDKEGKIVHVMHKVDTATHHDDVVNFFKNRG